MLILLLFAAVSYQEYTLLSSSNGGVEWFEKEEFQFVCFQFLIFRLQIIANIKYGGYLSAYLIAVIVNFGYKR